MSKESERTKTVLDLISLSETKEIGVYVDLGGVKVLLQMNCGRADIPTAFALIFYLVVTCIKI